MDLIYDYESDCSSTDSDQGELGSREIRKVYLVTYFNNSSTILTEVTMVELKYLES